MNFLEPEAGREAALVDYIRVFEIKTQGAIMQ
jgi:hypothetical protein